MQTPETYRDFFLQPSLPRHRTYEILRARFVQGLPVKEIARRFGRPPQTVQTVIRDFRRAWDRGEAPEFFVQKRRGPKADRKKPQVREHVVRLGAPSTARCFAARRPTSSAPNRAKRSFGLFAIGKS